MYVQLYNPTRRRSLGDVTSSNLLSNVLTPAPQALAATSTGVLSSPWLYVGAGLLAWFVVGKMSDGVALIGRGAAPRRRRRRSKRIPVFTAALYAAGAGAGGYLVGKYTSL